MRRPTKYVFLHIPKSAGMTFHRMIVDAFGEEHVYQIKPEKYDDSIRSLQQIEQHHPARIRVISGHAYYGFHDALPHQYVYLTILRDPLDRVLSYLDYVHGLPTHWLHTRLTNTQGIDFSSNYFLAEMSNLQTRMLSDSFVHDISRLPPLLRSHLEIAKRRLNDFGAIGILEEFDKFVEVVNRKFNWRLQKIPRQNVTAGHAFREATNAELMEKIREINQLDIELYEYAKELFHRQLDWTTA